MKRKLTTIIATILAIFMFATLFTGCSFLETDNEKDLNQVVAEVQTGDAEKEEILKKELLTLYYSYGQTYVNNGYSVNDALDLLLEGLISTAIKTQEAYRYLDGIFNDTTSQGYEFLTGKLESDETYENLNQGKYDIDRYLTNVEIVEAKYNVVKSFNDIIDSLLEEEEEAAKDTVVEADRTTPTNAKLPEEELTFAEKQAYLAKNGADAEDTDAFYKDGVNVGQKNTDRYDAYITMLKSLKTNELLGDEFNLKTDSLINTDYYADMLKSEKEVMLREKHEAVYNYLMLKNTTFGELVSRYETIYQAKVNDVANLKANFESDLKAYSATSPITYVPYNGYGFVYNLLLGIDDVQSGKLGLLDKEADDYAQKRKEILADTTATDLRSSWVKNGYGEVVNGEYVFNESYSGLNFNGQVTSIDEDNAKVERVNTFTLDEILAKINEYIGTATNVAIDNSVYGDQTNYYNITKFDGAVENYEQKVNDLLFAFSTDPGSLNTYKGYQVNPKVELGGTETYVEEFADGARYVLSELGGAGYAVVATDFGYHVIFYSKAITTADNCATLVDCLNAVLDETKDQAGWEAYYAEMIADIENEEFTKTYLYDMLSKYTTIDSFHDYEDSLIFSYKDSVTKYEKRYKV